MISSNVPFDGIYVTNDIDSDYLSNLELVRNDAAKSTDQLAMDFEQQTIGIHNNGGDN